MPIDLRVASDDRLARYRQPTFKAAPIHKRATIAATGRRHGLCASVTRTVSFGRVEPEFRSAHGLAAMVDATCIFFSRPSETVAEVFRRARRIYEKFDHPHEWTLDYQGFLVGYSPRETLLSPDSPLVLGSDTAVCWSPSVGPARSEDTMVIDAPRLRGRHRGPELAQDRGHRQGLHDPKARHPRALKNRAHAQTNACGEFPRHVIVLGVRRSGRRSLRADTVRHAASPHSRPSGWHWWLAPVAAAIAQSPAHMAAGPGMRACLAAVHWWTSHQCQRHPTPPQAPSSW